MISVYPLVPPTTTMILKSNLRVVVAMILCFAATTNAFIKLNFGSSLVASRALAIQHSRRSLPRRPDTKSSLSSCHNDEYTYQPQDPNGITQIMSSANMTNVIIKAHTERVGIFKPMSTLNHADMPLVDFSDFFRHCAPYISSHHGKTMVIHLPSTIFSQSSTNSCTKNEALECALHDIAILHLLGIKIVLVAGIREKIDERLHSIDSTKTIYHNGQRITDSITLTIIQEEIGKIRCEIERQFACGFHKSLAGKGSVSVISSNRYFTAKPLGVRQGIDYQYSGEIRKINKQYIQEHLNDNEIVLLTPLAYSPSGEMFYIPSESLSAETAIQLSASKLIYLTSNGESVINRDTNESIRSMRLSQTLSLLKLWGLNDKSTFNSIEDDCGMVRSPPQHKLETDCTPLQVANYVRSLARGCYALQHGVPRVHLTSPYSGSLLKELYTSEGSGMLLSRDIHDGVRPATPDDLPDLLEIIRPLEQEEILLPRTEEEILNEINDFYVLVDNDSSDDKNKGKVVGCGVLKQYSDTHAEIACLAVHPLYRKLGRGELILTYLEKRALTMNLTHVFILSTRTMQWFEERGFYPSTPNELPSTRKYNSSRGSKVYMKALGSTQHIEAEELWWDII